MTTPADAARAVERAYAENARKDFANRYGHEIEDAFATEYGRGPAIDAVPAVRADQGRVQAVLDTKENPKQAFGDLKPNLALVPGSAAVYMALALEYGAKKYGPFNWRCRRILAMTYIAAAKRHLDAWVDGQAEAEDSGVHHLGHALASLAVLVDALECSRFYYDDRPGDGNSAELHEAIASQRRAKAASRSE